MKYLGIDWGLKKIGLAVSEGELAEPLASLKVQGLNEAVNKIIETASQQNCELLIIGLPQGSMGKAVEKAAKLLKDRGMEVILSDETLTTKSALRLMIETGVPRKSRRDDNAVSAALILQRWLDDK